MDSIRRADADGNSHGDPLQQRSGCIALSKRADVLSGCGSDAGRPAHAQAGGAGAREVLYGISAAYRKSVGDVHAAGNISGHEYAGSHESGHHLWKLDNLDPSSPGEKGDQKGCGPFLGKRKEDGNLAVGGAVFSALSAEVVFELCPDGHAGSVPDDFYGKSLSFDQSCFPAA